MNYNIIIVQLRKGLFTEFLSNNFLKRLNFEWMDPRLAWNESHANGIEDVRLNRKDVWLPDIDIYNLVKKNHLGREGNDEVC